MLASVIIPCHNAERWIAAALKSVARQALAPYEIVVIDDSSTDGSLAQIRASGVPVQLLRVNARNAAFARNVGIRVAKGDWIAFLDADDVWYPNHLTRAAELLSSGLDVAFMSSHDWIGLDDKVIKLPNEFMCKLTAPKRGMNVDDYYSIVEQGFHFGHSTVLYRRDRVLEVGLFDHTQKRRHDIDLWLRMIADRTWTYDTLKSAGYRRNTPGSISRAELECDYYYLRALVKNLDIVCSTRHRQHLSHHARRAIGIAFTAGDPGHYARIRDLAWPHLSRRLKFLYSGAEMMPAFARKVFEAKRSFHHWDIPKKFLSAGLQ